MKETKKTTTIGKKKTNKKKTQRKFKLAGPQRYMGPLKPIKTPPLDWDPENIPPVTEAEKQYVNWLVNTKLKIFFESDDKE